MTVSSEVSSVSHAGDGVSTAFTVPFRFLSPNDLQVRRRNADGSVTLLTTGFSITGGDPTGLVTFDAAPEAGTDIIIDRAPQLLQPAAYPSNDKFPAATHEMALDRLTYQTQWLQRQLEYTLRFPFADGSAGIELPSAPNRASKYLAFDANGNPEVADLVEGTITRSIIGQLLYPQTEEERAAGVTPTDMGYPPGDVRRYGVGALDGTADWTTAIQAALNAGYSPLIPEGAILGVSATLETKVPDQVLTGLGNGAKLIKHADVVLFHILHNGSGARNITFEGAYDGGFGALSRPVGAPSVTDTTDCIQIGTSGTGQPAFWILDNVTASHAGRDGIHYLDGPGGKIGTVNCAYNARWGWWNDQSAAFDGGNAFDTAHTTATYLHCHHNGRGPHTQTEGGNMLIQGHAMVLNVKSFGAWGEGIRVFGALHQIEFFSELDAGSNTEIDEWASGEAVTAGTYRRNSDGVYVATTSGTTGATPPTHTSGTASDGAVTWRFRGNRSVLSVVGNRNKNRLISLFENGNREITDADLYTGVGKDGQTSNVVNNRLEARVLRSSRQSQFGEAGKTGDYSYIELAATDSTARQHDLAHQTTGAGPVDLFIGRNGSTDYPLRVRGSDYGHLADVSMGGRVVNCGDANYTLFGKDVSVGDTFYFAASAGREFNVHLGGDNILPGRRLRIISTTAQTIHIYATAPHATTLGAFGFNDTLHDLTAAGDWLDLVYLGNNLWWARIKKGGVVA